MTIRNRIPRRRLHVDLTQHTIKKDILNIKLRDSPLANRGNDDKSANSAHMSNMSKSLIIVTTILLLKATCNKTCLIVLNGAIRTGLDLIDPLTRDRSNSSRKGDNIPSTSPLKSIKLICHGKLLLRTRGSLMIRVGLNCTRA